MPTEFRNNRRGTGGDENRHLIRRAAQPSRLPLFGLGNATGIDRPDRWLYGYRGLIDFGFQYTTIQFVLATVAGLSAQPTGPWRDGIVVAWLLLVALPPGLAFLLARGYP